MFKSKYQFAFKDERNRCGRSVVVYLVGARTAIQNFLDFSAFTREIGMLRTCRLLLQRLTNL
jgi:hypothetical protein